MPLKVTRETLKLPVKKNEKLDLPVKVARESFRKFRPWKKNATREKTQKNTREAIFNPWGISKSIFHGLLFFSREKKNTAV